MMKSCDAVSNVLIKVASCVQDTLIVFLFVFLLNLFKVIVVEVALQLSLFFME